VGDGIGAANDTVGALNLQGFRGRILRA
jgi:hypothetical protein